MPRPQSSRGAVLTPAFDHRVLIYEDDDDLVRRGVRFLRRGLEADDRTVVVAPPAAAQALRAGLDGDASRVSFAWPGDARFAAAFDDGRRFLMGPGGRRVRALVQHPTDTDDPRRTRARMRWEAAANAVLAGADAVVACAYPARPDGAAHEARRTHPSLEEDGAVSNPDAVGARLYLEGLAGAAALTGDALPLSDVRDLAPAREMVVGVAREAGLTPPEVEDFLVAVNEAATNALFHARAPRALRARVVGGALVCEVCDSGPGLDPLAPFRTPDATAGGMGLWVIHQMCDAVEVRSDPTGTTLRLVLALRRGAERATATRETTA